MDLVLIGLSSSMIAKITALEGEFFLRKMPLLSFCRIIRKTEDVECSNNLK